MSYKTHMTDQEPAWRTCATTGCIGIRMQDEETCFAHGDPRVRKALLASVKTGSDLDLRGVPLDSDLLSQLLAVLRPQDSIPYLGQVKFERAQLGGVADFRGMQVSGFADFRGVHFSRNADFRQAQFRGPADFHGAQFSGHTDFRGAQFSGYADFRGARSSGPARFDEAQFSGSAEFEGTQFTRNAMFIGAQFRYVAVLVEARFRQLAVFHSAQFSGPADFRGVQFSEAALFDNAQFSGPVLFDEALFSGPAQFVGTQFKRAGTFGPVFAISHLILDRATFEHDMVIEAVGRDLSCVNTRFAEAATLRLRYTEVALDGAVFAKPSTIAFAPDAFKHHGQDDAEKEMFDEGSVVRAADGWSPQPRLLSLRGVDASTLTLSNLDLAACLFQGAHRLDQLRIEGARPFADTPRGWRFGHVGRGMPVWRWTRRQTLAEEHHWRAALLPSATPLGRPDTRRIGWNPAAMQPPPWLAARTGQQVQRPRPGPLAVVYRALRKAEEDRKNEPGAADFYYGEMEMRRMATASMGAETSTPRAERIILLLYWLVSGYGLRGSRALIWLAIVTVGLALLLQAIGFNGGDPSFRDALIYAGQSTLSLQSSSKALTEHVSWAGEALRIVLRLTGPILLGLALLSVRNRVKR